VVSTRPANSSIRCVLVRRPLVPTPQQRQIEDFPGLGLLVVAPAGCGKTEALALRVRGLIDQGRVSAPRRVLALTFSNRSRDNIRERLQGHLRPEQMRTLVSVSNFHGLAARLIRAHGNVIGVPAEVGIPSTDWVTRVCRDDLGLDYDAVDRVNALFREAKQSPRTDAEVLERLRASGSRFAVQVEERRQAERRVTYDDMLRLAELILANDEVAELYRQHFAAVVVDEFQDLTSQQLRVVQRIGAGRTTYAGDLAQGIYSFTGADPKAVLATIRSETSHEVTFAESHRSSPAVLDMVNALAPTVGGQALTCAEPTHWPSGGVAGSVRFANTGDEAAWIYRFTKSIVERAPSHRIAVVARYQKRRAALDAAYAADLDAPSFRWDQPFVEKSIVDPLRAALRRADAQAAARTASVREYLWGLVGGSLIQDPSTREHMDDAVAWAADEYVDGTGFNEIAAKVATLDGDSILTTPGVHLLNAHLGKGQQFDWVVVAGLEEGTLPFFKAKTPEELLEEARVLSVMISRARHGVVLTRVSSLWNRQKAPSRFLAPLEAHPSCRDATSLIDWMNSADWGRLAAQD
jgi:DNA helicase II / ATP-dependent DNA helicase PcrA